MHLYLLCLLAVDMEISSTIQKVVNARCHFRERRLDFKQIHVNSFKCPFSHPPGRTNFSFTLYSQNYVRIPPVFALRLVNESSPPIQLPKRFGLIISNRHFGFDPVQYSVWLTTSRIKQCLNGFWFFSKKSKPPKSNPCGEMMT